MWIGTELEFFAEAIEVPQFMGVNSAIVFYRNVRILGVPQKKMSGTAIIPTGSVSLILRQLAAFAVEHRLPVPDHIAP